MPVPIGQNLTEALDALPMPEDRQDLLDFEVSLGRMTCANEWFIERSTLPFKQERSWAIQLHIHARGSHGSVIEIADLDREGNRQMRPWRITESDHPQAASELDPRTRGPDASPSTVDGPG